MTEPTDDRPRGKVDLVSFVYVLFGVPAIVGFLIVIFALTRSCNIPA